MPGFQRVCQPANGGFFGQQNKKGSRFTHADELVFGKVSWSVVAYCWMASGWWVHLMGCVALCSMTCFIAHYQLAMPSIFSKTFI